MPHYYHPFYMRISAKTIRSNLSLISGTEMRTIANLKGMRILSERNKWHLKEITGRFKTIDKNLFYCFYGFLHNPSTTEDGGNIKIKSGWSSSWLKAWCSEHPGVLPFDCPIPENKREIANNVKLNYFSDIVELFKSEFQLRPETRQLKKLLRELVRQYLNFDFHVTF